MVTNNKDDFPLPASEDPKRRSAEFLPKFFRSEANKKFLSATLDQMIQPGVAEKINGYYGRKTAKAFNPSDNYIGDVSKERNDYQLEPAGVIKDNLGNVTFYNDYVDYINTIDYFNGGTQDHSLLNQQECYAWNPNIDWDKFTNFREYYWLPNGPQTVPILGQQKEITSTYTVTLQDNDDNISYLFTPDGKTNNPNLKLFRGQTYRFEIDTPGHPIAFAISRTFTPGSAIVVAGREGIRGSGLYDGTLYAETGTTYDIGDFVVLPDAGSVTFEADENVSTLYPDGITKFNEDGDEIATVYVEKGTIEFTIPDNAPDKLFYISKTSIDTSGLIKIFNIEENTEIDVEAEILGKKTYLSSNNVQLSNGMKIKFLGDVTPAKYGDNEWYVEGVGSRIRLVRDKDLIVPGAYSDDVLIPFDTNPFDRLPFGNASSYAAEKDYIVVNRASVDRNAWSRYNRWFHIDVIETSAQINGQDADIDQESRAKRPIIEFEAGLKLFKNGSIAKDDVDLIDNFTTDVFSTIEGSLGYNIDGVDLSEGQRILFIADNDILVNGKIYEVNFIKIGNDRQISLIEAPDAEPVELETVLVTGGNSFGGKTFYYENNAWSLAQEKTERNQPPKFDLFDKNGTSLGNEETYISNNFNGTTLFEYKIGEGTNDPHLGFPLEYKNIENSGDIVFNFSLNTDLFSYEDEIGVITKKTDTAFLKKFDEIGNFNYVNGLSSIPTISKQKVLRQYVVTKNNNLNFEIDVYDNADTLTDIKVSVFVNRQLQEEFYDWELYRINGKLFVRFTLPLAVNDIVLIKTTSSAPKNENGQYDIAYNLERNPLNEDFTEFTLGEVIDHVDSMIEDIPGVAGTFPGISNLRDLGELDHYGRRFIKHSGPVNLPLYHITSKEHNIVNAIRYSKREYARFKRTFAQIAVKLEFDGSIREHVDAILEEMNLYKKNTQPFYFSDMIGLGPSNKIQYEVLDPRNPYYALTTVFDKDILSSKAVNVYLNDTQLVHGKDYTFNNDGFCLIDAGQELGDIIEIYEYESTDGTYIPPTPTKLGLYPAYEPAIKIDDTYQEPTTIIEGHDGSITVGWNDYRDQLFLELEKRIYNNIKQQYNTEIFDINDFVGGEYRNTGFSRQKINDTLLNEFIEWSNFTNIDYTNNDFYQRTNTFTYNHRLMTSPSGENLPGFWRGVFNYAYDTDRPHTHPWEMLGFSVKPTWWNEVYGPAPYTSNNLVLWKDLEEGIIREPNKPLVVKSKYTRPGLLNHIPVDSQGKLVSPVNSNFAKGYVQANTSVKFAFGDEAPSETAWRRSSEYPFAIITAWLLNQPAKVMGIGFDISRIKRNMSNQLVYTVTDKPISNKSLVFPNTTVSSTRTLTSGLVNYIYNLISSDVLSVYEDYRNNLSSLRNQLGIKLAGFSDKSKFKIILDSKSPGQDVENGVFVPEENYQLFLNKSAVTDVAIYSGVILEKNPSGYIIRGYSSDNPYFDYFEPVSTSSDVTVTVGGVSESFVVWQPEKTYGKGQLIAVGNEYYRATETFKSGTEFTQENLTKLAELPLKGGKRAQFKRKFSGLARINYGTILRTSQEVVDFLLGYGEYLKNIGFDFNNFDNETQLIENWDTAAREFLFFTTQGWASGTTIAISPAANLVSHKGNMAVADNIFDEFYGYSLYKADGSSLTSNFASIFREDNAFTIKPKQTLEGIYHIKIPLVQNEHVVLIDNVTEFNDIIYQPSSGYRRERLKVLGYRTDDWNGSLNIPGFIFDDAKVQEWTEYKDFDIGSLVKYKEFYYVATKNVPGTQSFESKSWYRLNEKPESQLITNFEYKINQFPDFYDLDSDNFDVEQQKIAQHLIGYQKRDYLANIIQDDVSQYKFYQGFIQDKGTTNALTKLFDVLSAEDKDSIEFYEEWAIQTGRYGSIDNVEQVAYILDEKKFDLPDKQPIELVDQIDPSIQDQIYRQLPYQAFDYPEGYNHKPFPTKNDYNEYIKTGGNVSTLDINWRLNRRDNILATPVERVALGDYIWTVRDDESWNVYEHTETNYRVEQVLRIDGDAFDSIDALGGVYEIILDRYILGDITVGDIVGIIDAPATGNNNFLLVDSINANSMIVLTAAGVDFTNNRDLNNALTTLRSVRVADANELNIKVQERLNNNQRIWIDDYGDGNWAVLQNQTNFAKLGETTNPADFDSTYDAFAEQVAISSNNRYMIVPAPYNNDGIVHAYTRTRDSDPFTYSQELVFPDTNYINTSSPIKFGESIAITPDGNYLAIGTPTASNVKTRYKGAFDGTIPYNKNDIVKYRESLWKANKSILPQTGSQQFSTFDAYTFIARGTGADSTAINLLVTGNPLLPNVDTDHFLVRAPYDMYIGSKPGDVIALSWNRYTNANGILAEFLPWDGTIPELSADEISGEFEIIEKVDKVLFVDTFVQVPAEGSVVSTDTGSGTVAYRQTEDDSLILYLKNVNGIFDVTGELFTGENSIGQYTEEPFLNEFSQLGGYFQVSAPTNYSSGEIWFETGNGLIIRDLKLEGSSDDTNPFMNVNNTVSDIGTYNGQKNRASEILNLGYITSPIPEIGDPDYNVLDTEGLRPSDLFVVRMDKTFTSQIENRRLTDSTIYFELYNLSNYVIDPTPAGFTFDILNKEHEIYDIWDGYIDFEYTKFVGDDPFEPVARFEWDGTTQSYVDKADTLSPGDPITWDTIVDVQTPFDGLGGLAPSSSTTSSAEVMFYQRENTFVRVYLKITSGTFNQQNNIGRYELRRVANTTLRGAGDVDRVMGQIDDQNQDIALGTDNIGKLIVFKNTVTHPDTGSTLFPIIQRQSSLTGNAFAYLPKIINEEYWFYDEEITGGISRLANFPYTDNKDYTQVYNIPATEFGIGSSMSNEGIVSIYRRLPNNTYRHIDSIVSENRSTDKKFGSYLKFTQNNESYKLFVSSPGNTGTIEIFEHGVELETAYKGFWQATGDYIIGDVVLNQGRYYRCVKNVTNADDIPLTDTIYWNDISWRTSKDRNFRGVFENSLPYAEDSIIIYDDKLYKAITNIAAGESFDNASFERVISGVDYLGYLPNRLSTPVYDFEDFDASASYSVGDVVVYSDKIYQAIENISSSPSGFVLNQWSELEELQDDVFYDPAQNVNLFGDVLDSTSNGEILVTRVTHDDLSVGPRIVVYRNINDRYYFDQKLDQVTAGAGYGDSFAISNDGKFIAVSEPFNSDIKTFQGKVYVYEQINGNFELVQTILSPSNEVVERFGAKVAFDENQLVISSLNGDMKIPTIFDSGNTRFDNGFTEFKNVQLDSGKVYLFERVSNRYIFAEDLKYQIIEQAKLEPTIVNGEITNVEIVDPGRGYSGNVDYILNSGSGAELDIKLDNFGQIVKVDVVKGGSGYTSNTRIELPRQSINFKNFGEYVFANNNHIYVGMPMLGEPETYTGTIIDFRKNSGVKSWNVVRRGVTPVNLEKIESVFLYNKATEQFITYLDYIDPVQGKIAGPAEQEISYKIPYDPAMYNVASVRQLIDTTDFWGPEHVGQLWWDVSEPRFVNAYQGDITSQSLNWNKLLPGNSVDVYEWVESDILPSEWDIIADTEAGLLQGISGTSLYSDAVYSRKLRYDPTSNSFVAKYYFWVRAKANTPPNLEFRNNSALSVTNLITDPAAQGYRYVAITAENKFVIYNCGTLLDDDNVVIVFKYRTDDKPEQNTHSQYQIISEGLSTSKPKKDIERKWFDSLIGYDDRNRRVPDPNLPISQRYGSKNKPRQSMFVNKIEALKQVIERANIVLASNLIIDEYDISDLFRAEVKPSSYSRLYDTVIDTVEELRLIGTAKITPAVLSPVISNGRIIRVDIVDPGRGYKDPSFTGIGERKGPKITVNGTGSDAEIECVINNLGQIIRVDVIDTGKNYNANTKISVRNFSVLVNNDSTVYNKWAIYNLEQTTKLFSRISVQDHDVSLFWNYIDWYADDYNEFTKIDYKISQSYELEGLPAEIGQIVKIENVGTGGWLLLRKIANEIVEDYTQNYETIGRQNGTIQFKNTLYDFGIYNVGYDTRSYDSWFYDNSPVVETRIILEALRDNIFTKDLEVEYNKLFFASMRYVFTEQPNVDWIFKTSTIKAQHNLGELKQSITFKNDTLPSYEEYIKEVKPYSVNIREYVSNYDTVDNTQTLVSDFDLPPGYDSFEEKIISSSATIKDNTLINVGNNVNFYPRRNWLENYGYQIKEIKISDKGFRYNAKPTVTIQGGGGSGATAEAFLGAGYVTRIKVTNPGSGYTSAPEVVISGTLADGGREAKASAVLGNGVVRSTLVKVKFDRISGEFYVLDKTRTDSFVGTASKTVFDLKWPMDLDNKSVKVFVDGEELLRSQFTYENVEDAVDNIDITSDFIYQGISSNAGPGIGKVAVDYTKTRGRIIIDNPPALNSTVTVEYSINQEYLTAQDRIRYNYKPTSGMPNVELGQLMNGIDYGGVEVKSFDFSGPSGWDSDPWYSSTWDTYDNTYEDELFTFDGSTSLIELQNTLEDTVRYNFYLNGVRIDDPVFHRETFLIDNDQRVFNLDIPLQNNIIYHVYVNDILIDDPNYGTGQIVENENAVIQTIIGDGTTTTIDLTNAIDSSASIVRIEAETENKNASTRSIIGDGITNIIDLDDKKIIVTENDTLIIRKETSDGAFIPDPESYDTQLSGGDLAYTTATGVNAEDINVDGDGFITPTSTKGPEELIPGQVLDTVDIKVFTRDGSGTGQIYSQSYITNGVDKTFNLGVVPGSSDSIIVKIDNQIVSDTEYTVNWINNTLTLDSIPASNKEMNIVSVANGQKDVLESGKFIADGSTIDFVTPVTYSDEFSVYTTINGIKTDALVVESETALHGVDGKIVLRFEVEPNVDDVINYVVFYTNEIINYSQIQKDDFSYTDGFIILTLSTASTDAALQPGDIITQNITLAEGTLEEVITETDVDDNITVTRLKLKDIVGDFAVGNNTLTYTNSQQVTNTLVYTPSQGLVVNSNVSDIQWNTILTQAPLYSLPSAHNTIVKVGNKILNPGYNQQFIIGNEKEFGLELFQQPNATLIESDLSVFLNGEQIVVNEKWRPNTFNSSVVLFDDVGNEGDVLEVYVTTDGEYYFEGNEIYLKTIPSTLETVSVYQFTNHDILEIERINYDVVARSTLTFGDGTGNYATYHRLTAGEIALREPAVDSQYVWVSINGELLTPNVDYYVTSELNKIQLVQMPNQNDVIDILHFTSKPVVPAFAYRQFKDILNRTHYKRLDSAETVLAQDLNVFDLRIELEDASNLPIPDRTKNIPGILFINGERIEYFIKENNTLRQIRRGTLGTGVPNIHSQGSKVYNQGIEKTMPYQDETISKVYTADGTTNVYPLDFDANTLIENYTNATGESLDPNNFIEVFVAGRRLRKNSIFAYQTQTTDASGVLQTDFIDQTSPQGDIELEGEYTIDLATNTLVLNNITPIENTQILVVRKIGREWKELGQKLADADNDIARFLRAGTIDLPE